MDACHVSFIKSPMTYLVFLSVTHLRLPYDSGEGLGFLVLGIRSSRSLTRYRIHRAGKTMHLNRREFSITHGLTTPRIADKIMSMETFRVVEKLFTGRSSFLVKRSLSSAANKDSGVGLLQFSDTVKPESRRKRESHYL